MLRVGGAAAIAAEVYFTASLQRGGYHLGRLLDAGKENVVSQDFLLGGYALSDGFSNSWIHRVKVKSI